VADPAVDGGPIWSNDGTRLAIVRGYVLIWSPPVSSERLLIDPATGEARSLGWTAASHPSWQRLAP